MGFGPNFARNRLLDGLLETEDFQKFLKSAIVIDSDNANSGTLADQLKQQNLNLEYRLELKKRFRVWEAATHKKPPSPNGGLDKDDDYNFINYDQLQFRKFTFETTSADNDDVDTTIATKRLNKEYNDWYQERLNAAKNSALGSLWMHRFYVWAGLYSAFEATFIALAATHAAMENVPTKELADFIVEFSFIAGAFTFFVPVTLILWCAWNLVDAIGVYIDAYKDFKNGNKKLAITNFVSATSLLIGTAFTAVVLYGGLLGGAMTGLGFAPVAFAACMFFSALAAHFELVALRELRNNLGSGHMTLANFSNGAVAEQAFEKVKQIVIDLGIANTDQQELDVALMGLTLDEVNAILDAQIKLKANVRFAYTACGFAMTAVAIMLITTVGAAVFLTNPIGLAVIASIIVIGLLCSIATRLYLRHQEGVAKNQIMTVLGHTPDILNNEANKKYNAAISKPATTTTTTTTTTSSSTSSKNTSNSSNKKGGLMSEDIYNTSSSNPVSTATSSSTKPSTTWFDWATTGRGVGGLFLGNGQDLANQTHPIKLKTFK